MSSETTFKARIRRPSQAFVLVILITVVGLVIAFALPSLVLPKFANQPTTLLFQVRVVDDQGVPVPGASVFVGSASAQTDLEGYAEVKQSYLAKGVKGLSGTCRVEGELRVEAAGYLPSKQSLQKLFGGTYDYIKKGSTVAHEVALLR